MHRISCGSDKKHLNPIDTIGYMGYNLKKLEGEAVMKKNAVSMMMSCACACHMCMACCACFSRADSPVEQGYPTE